MPLKVTSCRTVVDTRSPSWSLMHECIEPNNGNLETGSVREIRPKIPVGTKKCVGWGFGYGESEYEVSFGLAPRSGELSPSDPKTPEPFNSPFRARNPEI